MTRRTREFVDLDPEGAAATPPSSSKTKRPRTEKDGEEEEEETKQIWMNSSARSLDCTICLMPFEAEIYMCTNGHAACASCCLRINRKCWCCAEPIGDIRCRPLEALLADHSTHCRFRRYGCAETLRYTERRAHEDSCPRAPLNCPLDGCTYRGLLLLEHVLDEHRAGDDVAFAAYLRGTTVTVRKRAPFRVLVVQQAGGTGAAAAHRRGVYLLLNGGEVLGGRCLSLVRLGTRPEGEENAPAPEIKYKMEVRGGEPGSDALTLAAAAPCVRSLEEYRARKFLFVPDADWGSSGTISVSIRIG